MIDLALWSWVETWIVLAVCGISGLAFAMLVYGIQRHVRNRIREARRTRLEERWRPILVRILSGEEGPESLRSLVKPREEEFFLEFLVRFGRRFQHEEQARLERLARPVLWRAVERLDHGDPTVRAAAAETVAVLGSVDEHDDEIVRALDDPAPIVSFVAARALMAEKRDRYVRLVLHRLDRYANVSGRFLSASLALAGEAAIPALRRFVLEVGIGTRERRIALEALTRIPDTGAGPIVEEILRGDDDRDLRAAALRLAEEVGGPDELSAVRRLVESDDPVLRTHAARALGSIGTREDVFSLKRRLEDESPWVALSAARALDRLGATLRLEWSARDENVSASLVRQVADEERREGVA